MERAFVRIDLADGQWWEVWSVLTRGMRKAMNQGSLAALPPGLKMCSGDVVGNMRENMLAYPSKLNLNAVDDAMLLAGSKGFSWGPIVSLQAIDEIPDADVQRVLAEMYRLYGLQTVTQEDGAGFFARP